MPLPMLDEEVDQETPMDFPMPGGSMPAPAAQDVPADWPQFKTSPMPDLPDPLTNFQIPPNLSAREAQSLFNVALTLRRSQQEGQAAAIRYQGMTEYQQAVKAGVPVDEALRMTAPKMFFRHPEGLAQVVKAMTPRPAPAALPGLQVQDIGGQKMIVRQNRFGEQFAMPIRPPSAAAQPETPQSKMERTVKTHRMNKLIDASEKLREKMNDPLNIGSTIGELRLAKDKIDDELRTLMGVGVTNAPSVEAPPASSRTVVEPKTDMPSDVLPVPSKKSELIKGKRYATKRGVATWDGENFVQ